MIPTDLLGARVWLSGSIPDRGVSEEGNRLKAFVKGLAKAIFREGGQLLHGFHPSITPTLLEAAREYRTARERRAQLVIFVSAYFRDAEIGYDGHTVFELEEDCELQQIPQGPTRERSIEVLRETMASQSDVLVAIGGRWWDNDRANAGVPAEFLLAIERGIPSFLLGNLSGATAGYLQRHPEILTNLRNGLDAEANQALAETKDIDALTSTVLNQIARLPLGRREAESGQLFRILCLDGGGLRGAFAAAVLARWEEMANLRVADHFDLIAGTSTGGLLAIGLGLGLSAQDMVNFYREHGTEIFPLMGFWGKLWQRARNLSANEFDAALLEKELSVAFDREGRIARLRDSRRRLLITSYDLTSNSIRIYRTSHHPDVKGHDHLRAVVVARATSASPSYFKPAPVNDPVAPEEGVDGGIWANCPGLAALGEAVGVLRIPLNRIDVLSVGTAGLATLVETPGAQGQLGWAANAVDMFMNSQTDAVLLYLKQLLGDRIKRVDDPMPHTQNMDDSASLPYLIGRGARVGESEAKEVMSRFLNGVAATDWRKL